MAQQRHKPYLPVDWSRKAPNGQPMIARAYALQALMMGEATSEQQVLAIKCLVEDLADTYQMSYSPDSDRDTAFAEGRRYVGLQIVKLQGVNLSEVYGPEGAKNG